MPFPTPGDLPDPGIKPISLCLLHWHVDSLPTELSENPSTGDLVQFLDQEDPLEKEMAAHSSILVWRIPWIEEAGRLPSMWLQRV